ncbi:TetR/AcrR family transcriptional regulator [Haloimpatiens sp. FM7330]|uniref:TetR/AcrR family transcriptional regulator n=1 Tax=Haloimpatiens sp. FM7330 TaxID=3298610 RepID=UPI00362E6335
MPPKIVVNEENIKQAGFEIIKTSGIENLTARNIAKKLKCSTQPIYRAYANMDALKEELFIDIRQYFLKYIFNYKKVENEFLNTGLGYIDFAKNESNLFKALYLTENLDVDFDREDTFDLSKGIEQMNEMPIFSNLSEEEIKDIMIKLWIFTHGLATMVMSPSLNITDEKIIKMLSEVLIKLCK